jgi:polysaccharide pyruvyl transferase WcaK-like protein
MCTSRPTRLSGSAPTRWYRSSGRESRPRSELPVVGVRGPMSKDYLEEAGGRNVVVCGDPAVLFHLPSGTAEPSRDRKQLRIGINCGRLVKPWGSPQVVSDVLAAVARHCVHSGHAVELLAVRPEDVPSCFDVAQKAGLPKDAVCPLLSRTEAFLAKMPELDVVVALRLHCAILSAAATVPFLGLEYQPKCMDFARSIGWDEYFQSTASVQADWLIERLQWMAQNLPSLRQRLCACMCQLSRQFQNYCRQIEALLGS